MPLIEIDGRVFGAIVCFRGDVLDSISLTMNDPPYASWADWSEESENKRDTLHNAWLTEALGPDREFSWGTVWAGRDAKTRDSQIVIRYDVDV